MWPPGERLMVGRKIYDYDEDNSKSSYMSRNIIFQRHGARLN
jgi:hypothetical protein